MSTKKKHILLLLFICLSLMALKIQAQPPSKDTGQIINILMMRGSTFEQSNVSGILGLIKKGSKAASYNQSLYQNLEMYFPFSHTNVVKILNMLSSLTSVQQLEVNTIELLELTAKSMKLVDSQAIELLRSIQNQAIDHETARLAASLVLKYSPHHEDALEKLKQLAENSWVSIFALSDLLNTKHHDWAYKKLLELSNQPKTGGRMISLLINKRYPGKPTLEIVENLVKHVDSKSELESFLFYLEADFKDVYDAYKAKNNCAISLGKLT